MRRFAVLAVLVLALAVPAVALAKTTTTAFTLGKGHTGRTFHMTLAHTGRIQVVLRYSRLHNPKADLIMSLHQPGQDGNVILDTGSTGQGCKAAGDSYVCSIYISGVAAGKWVIGLGKESHAAVAIHLRLSWPAT
jgi:transketolase N-terminal domain/subunit